ncbi:MAG: IclR family transcriptional regulator [Acidimicrobiales bacterium]
MVAEGDRVVGAGAPDRYQVRSVQRALEMLEIVASGPTDGMSLTVLADRLAISKSTALSTARTLVGHGMLRAVEPGPRYKLGTALIRYGDLVAQQNPVGEVCLPVLRQVSAETAMTARLALAEDGYAVCVERVDGPGSIRFHAPLGGREPPHATAAGKSVLAMLDDARVRVICEEVGLPAHTAHTITDAATLFEELGTVRRRGFAVDDEEEVEGVFCVGAPFFGHDRECAGAISVTGIKQDLPGWRIAELGRLLRHYADTASALIGGSTFADLLPPRGVAATTGRQAPGAEVTR